MEQNLNLYQIFYEVAGCRNFSVAAKKLYITQPAVSKAISRLEESLDTVLFYRSSRGVCLTPEGEVLCRHVEQALTSLKAGEDQIRAFVSQKVSRLSIGVSTTLCKYVLLPLLGTFITENPNIKISISCQSTSSTIAALQEGAIDIGLVGLGHLQDDWSRPITCLPLKTIEDIFVASDSYLSPFYGKYGGDLFDEPAFLNEVSFIMLDKENISRKHADSFLAAHQIELINIIEVNHMDLAIEFARAGLGIACVIGEFVKDDLEKGTLTEVRPGHKVPKRQIGFAYSSRSPLSSSMEKLIQYYLTRV